MSADSTDKPVRRARKNVNRVADNGQLELEPATAEKTPNPPETAGPPDPFDVASLRLDTNQQAGAIGVKRKIVTMPVRRPDKQEFVRVHPDESFRLDTGTIQDKRHREAYLVAPGLWDVLPDFIVPTRLCLAVTRHREPFLWPAVIPDSERPNDWHVSMMEAQRAAVDKWVRVQSAQSSYAIFEATGNLPDPEWPEDLTFQDALKLAFKVRFIDSVNHPFVLELLGDV